MLVAISIALALLGLVCGKYQVKGAVLSRTQVGVLWTATVAISAACAYFYYIGGNTVFFALYLILCVGQLVGILFGSGRD